jgi:hypothetical protein
MTLEEFQNELRLGIPDPLPEPQPYDPTVNHAPKRKDILTPAEKKLAIRNALRYFPAKHHKMLAKEFAEELKKYGRIYMYRLRPTYKMYARPIDEYPAKSRQAAAIMAMISMTSAASSVNCSPSGPLTNWMTPNSSKLLLNGTQTMELTGMPLKSIAVSTSWSARNSNRRSAFCEA